MRKSRYLQSDKTEKIYTSAKHEGTSLYITSRGDDILGNKRGKGSQLIIDNSIDKRTYKMAEIQFLDDIFLKDGFILWENAVLGDTITLEIILPAGVLFPALNNLGNFNIINGVPVQISQEDVIGTHIMYTKDTVISRYVNEFSLLGTNYTGIILESSDTVQIQKELKIRFVLNSPSQSDIKAIFNLEAYRYNTI